MKIRLAFVSNSSSSSYICCISNQTVICDQDGNWDGGIAECENNHTISSEFILCEAIAVTKSDKLSDLQNLVQFFVDDRGFYERKTKKTISIGITSDEIKALDRKNASEKTINELYAKANLELLKKYYQELIFIERLPEFRCPVCMFMEVEYNDIIQYLLVSMYGKDSKWEDAKKDILKRFETSSELKSFISGTIGGK